MKGHKNIFILLLVLIGLGNFSLLAQNSESNPVVIYSSEDFFRNEYEGALRTEKAGQVIFWTGAGLTATGFILSLVSSVLYGMGTLDQETSSILSVTGFSLSSVSLVMTVSGNSMWSVGNNRRLSLVETREKFFTPR